MVCCLGGCDENNELIVCFKDFCMNMVLCLGDVYCFGYLGVVNELVVWIIYCVV